MKIASSILILLIATTAILFATQAHCQASITQAVSDALDAAVQDLTTDTAWIAYYSKNMYFNVPTCAGTVKWPAKDPFVGRTALNMCWYVF